MLNQTLNNWYRKSLVRSWLFWLITILYVFWGVLLGFTHQWSLLVIVAGVWVYTLVNHWRYRANGSPGRAKMMLAFVAVVLAILCFTR